MLRCRELTRSAQKLGWLQLDILDAKLLSSPRQQLIELRLGWPDDLFLKNLHQTIDRGIGDYRLEDPIVFVLNIYEHRKGILPLLQDRDKRHRVIRNSRLYL